MTSLNRPREGNEPPGHADLGPELATSTDEDACDHSACQPCKSRAATRGGPNLDCRSIALGVMLELSFRFRSFWPLLCPHPPFAVTPSPPPCLPRCASFSVVAVSLQKKFAPSMARTSPIMRR